MKIKMTRWQKFKSWAKHRSAPVVLGGKYRLGFWDFYVVVHDLHPDKVLYHETRDGGRICGHEVTATPQWFKSLYWRVG